MVERLPSYAVKQHEKNWHIAKLMYEREKKFPNVETVKVVSFEYLLYILTSYF